MSGELVAQKASVRNVIHDDDDVDDFLFLNESECIGCLGDQIDARWTDVHSKHWQKARLNRLPRSPSLVVWIHRRTVGLDF